MKDNPKAALAALTSPAKLTLGKVALLCRLDSPILAGKIDDMPKCLTAIFVVENDFADSVANFSRIEDLALIAYGGISPLEYRQKLAHTLDEVAAFFEMLPRPSPASKKTRQRMGRRARRMPLPNLRLPSGLCPRRTPGGPGGAPLAMLGAGAGRKRDRHAPRGRARV